MCTFHFEMHKTADFQTNPIVSWEKAIKEDAQNARISCVERPLPGMAVLNLWS